MHVIIPLASDFSLLQSLPSRARFKGLMELDQAHMIFSLHLTQSQLTKLLWTEYLCPPHSNVEPANPQCNGIWRWGVGEMSKLRRGRDSGGPP